MKKNIPLFIGLLFTLTSCLKIIEEIKINDDLSGNITYRLETNNSGSLLNSITKFFDVSFTDQLKNEVAELASKLRNKEGITNVEFLIDEKTDNYFLSYDFTNTKDLNNALYGKKGFFSPSYIKISEHKFKKLNFAPWLKKYFKKEDIQVLDDEILEIITYQAIYYFPREVIRVKNKTARLSDDRKTVSQSYQAADIIENKVNVGNKIKY